MKIYKLVFRIPENSLNWVKAYNHIYVLNAGKFVAKLDLLEHSAQIEYGGDRAYHGDAHHTQKKIEVKFRRYVLSVRKQDHIDFVPICYFIVDTRDEDKLTNKYELEEQARAYELRLISAVDNKFWTLDGRAPGKEIFDRSIEILKAMAFI